MAKYDKSMEYISRTTNPYRSAKKTPCRPRYGRADRGRPNYQRALGQKQFWKIYLMDFLQVLGGF